MPQQRVSSTPPTASAPPPLPCSRMPASLIAWPRSSASSPKFSKCWHHKSATLFPTFNAALQSSMLQGIQLFLKNIVLAPNSRRAVVFDSDQTFVDAKLAAIYGVQAPASGFAQVQLPPSSGRAGILGQASRDRGPIPARPQLPNSARALHPGELPLQTPPPPPAGVIHGASSSIPTPRRAKSWKMHRANATCTGCHGLFDPLGLAMEHFDAIGQYRATENGLAIDATGSLNGVVTSTAQRSSVTVLRQNAKVDDMPDAQLLSQRERPRGR